MKTLILASLIATSASFGAMAQTSNTAPAPSNTSPAPSNTSPAPATTSPAPAPAPADANAPLPGANSFTEGQAKSRLEANGYTNVSALKKDDNGVWKGTATHSGAQVNVSVDYRGNVTRN